METENKASRQQYWNELSTEDKVERMRQVVKSLSHNLSRLDRAVSRLSKHQHAQDGTVLHPMDHDYGTGETAKRLGDNEVYF